MSWLVLGGGRSGLGAALLLHARGKKVLVADAQKLPPATKETLKQAGIAFFEERNEPALLADTTAGLVLSPGIPLSHPLVVCAKEKGLAVISEIDLALADYPGTIIAVTGTNGKSTTTAMIAFLLEQLHEDAVLTGNIGTPPSLLLATRSVPAMMALELSSYQLEQSERVAPKVAIITNISPDHLSRHGSFERYFEEKWKIFKNMGPKDSGLIGEDVAELAERLKLPLPGCPLEVLARDKALAFWQRHAGLVDGWHNQLNAYFAIHAVQKALSSPPSLAEICPLFAKFRGLPHRYEKIAKIKGKNCINDSKATNVASTLVALSLQHEPTLLFLGGQGKGEAFTPIRQYQKILAGLVVFGEAKEAITKDLEGLCPLFIYPSLKAALKALPELLSHKPLEVLFSPACASYDEFGNFEERGDYFRETMRPYCD